MTKSKKWVKFLYIWLNPYMTQSMYDSIYIWLNLYVTQAIYDSYDTKSQRNEYIYDSFL